ncbi:MAG: replicative DNA helicase [Proteobacteria bacterium]|nr:replicative DNA helicase [Pseudomonadota bacterium]
MESVLSAREDGVTYRTLPHNLEAEQALLGAILVNNEVANRVSAFLFPDHFFQPVHGRIYEAALKIVERGQRADPVTLKHYFETDDALADIGGAQYLARLAGSAVTIINAEDYGRTVHDLYLRRELIHLGEDVVNTAFDFRVDTPAREQVEEAEQHLYTLAEEGQYEGGFAPLKEPLESAIKMMESAYKRDGDMTGVATGLAQLDELLGGLNPADLIILAGRPSMGKTALATNIAYHASKSHRVETDDDGNAHVVDGAVVGFFSLEMSAEQLAFRLLAEATGVSAAKLRRGQVSPEEFQHIVPASQTLSRIPFFIDDTPSLSVAALRTRARRLKRTHNLSLVIVDYLQLMRPSGRKSYDNRVLEIAEITQGLKALAKELGVPVLALSQLSRAVEQRDDKRPQLSDLRESGAIEQDADVVMFIYREEYYERRKEPKEGTDKHIDWQNKMNEINHLAEVIVAKQRSGPIGRVDLVFDPMTTKFTTLDRRHDPEDVPF